MKKRFTLMMMVLCFLMSIPLKMMANDEIKAVSHYKQNGSWTVNSNFNFTTDDGKIYTCELKDVPANETVYFRIVKNGKEWGPNSGSNLKLTSEYQTIYQVDNSSVSLQIGPSTVQSTYTITYDSENNQIKYTSTSGGNSGSTTDDTWAETENRLKGRVYTQGLYLAGNFFSFSGDEVTYDDAVFKFQQQSNKKIGETDYEVYKVEIPASLTAHAQVMYVNEVGKITYVFGPGSGHNAKINKDNPVTDKETEWASLTANESTNLLKENNNYWNLISRNQSATEYTDGMYELYIAFDKNTNSAKWMIKHIQKKRVAYFVSTDPSATALPVYDYSKKLNDTEWQYSNQFFASVYFASDCDYYVISNYINKDYIDHSP